MYVCVQFSLQEYYNTTPENRDLSSTEKALKQYLLSDSGHSSVRKSICDLIRESPAARSSEEDELRRELQKFMRPGDSGNREVVFIKPRTLKAFIEEENDRSKLLDCKIFKCSFVLFSDRKR